MKINGATQTSYLIVEGHFNNEAIMIHSYDNNSFEGARVVLDKEESKKLYECLGQIIKGERRV